MFKESEEMKANPQKGHVSDPVFRGHANAEWKLETTLERELGKYISLKQYYDRNFYPSLRTLKGILNIDLPDKPRLPTKIWELQEKVPLADEMAKLRHHGFPSPLLDWTHSPYVAAFFAFNPIPTKTVKRIAIYAYREYLGEGKGYDGDKPYIRSLGFWSPVHELHIRQQSIYTLCVRKSKQGFIFFPHEEADIERPFSSLRFDDIVKITIPISQRKVAIDDLRRMNITEMSLFNTIDAAVRTVARFSIEMP